MAMTLVRTYEAFEETGASDEVVREAAEEIDGFEKWLSGIENRLIRVEIPVTVVLASVTGLIAETFHA